MNVKTTDFDLVETDRDLTDLINSIMNGDRYAIDTEFQRERTYYPARGLIQMATAQGISLVDPLACDVRALGRLFESDVLAVAHAIDQDLEVLQYWCGSAPRRIFDTQIGAGFLGFSTAGLSALSSVFLGFEVTKTDRLTDWTQRPLTDSQLAYAAGDVSNLLALFDAVATELMKRGRLAWAEDECTAVLSRIKTDHAPEIAWWKLKEARQLRGRARFIAQELAAWRERRAREQDLPIRFVLPDLAIAVIAQQEPDTVTQLREIRGVDARHLKNGTAEAIIANVSNALLMPESALRLPGFEAVDKSTRAAATLVAAWVGQLGKELDIDPGLLATRSEIDAYLAGREDTRLQKGWRADLLGEPIRRLVTGEASLAFGESGELILEERSRIPIADQ